MAEFHAKDIAVFGCNSFSLRDNLFKGVNFVGDYPKMWISAMNIGAVDYLNALRFGNGMQEAAREAMPNIRQRTKDANEMVNKKERVPNPFVCSIINGEVVCAH
jgi:hypothetical protein